MARLQAELIEQDGDEYHFRVVDVDTNATFTFNIKAPSVDHAAMIALRNAENLDPNTSKKLRGY